MLPSHWSGLAHCVYTKRHTYMYTNITIGNVPYAISFYIAMKNAYLKWKSFYQIYFTSTKYMHLFVWIMATHTLATRSLSALHSYSHTHTHIYNSSSSNKSLSMHWRFVVHANKINSCCFLLLLLGTINFKVNVLYVTKDVDMCVCMFAFGARASLKLSELSKCDAK